MAATDRFNTASFGVLPNKNPANAISFDEKVPSLRFTAEMKKT